MKIRSIFIISFLLLAHTVFCQSGPTQWEKDIIKFEKADSVQKPLKNAILFTGSSSIRGWRDVQNDFPYLNTINRGFGGSTIADVNYYFDRIVSKYKPEVVVFYAGDNDISGGKSPEEVLEDFREFAGKMKRHLPKSKLIFLSIKPSIARWDIYPKMEEANHLIRDFAARNNKIQFVDVSTPMLKDGKPDESLFFGDGLHMNRKGYDLWKEILQPYLKR